MKAKKFDFFVPVIFVIVFNPITIYRWADAYPTELLEIDDENVPIYMPSWHLDDTLEGFEENDVLRREEALENLQKIFGIRGHIENKSTTRDKIPPQFMMELYNTIADSSGVTRGRNPYNAKVVRSFVEKDTLFSHLYLFNISGLEINESVLEAELHLYRKRTTLKSIHPTILTSPYYLIRVYQVLEGKSMSEPDLHRLLNVHYVGAHASGWQVFNVKQAVLAWVSGTPNLGLMVTASNLFDDDVSVEFSRRNDYHNSKQPILVLFDDDGRGPLKSEKNVAHYYSYENKAGDFDSRAYDHHDESEEREETNSTNENDENLDTPKRHRESSNKKRSPSNAKREFNKERSYGTQIDAGELQKDEMKYFRREKRIDNDNYEDNSKRFLINEDYMPDNSFEREDNVLENKMAEEEKSEGSLRSRRDAIKRNELQSRENEARKFVWERRARIPPDIIVSMDIYERAMLRQRMTRKNDKKHKNEKRDEDDYRRVKRSTRTTENKEEETSRSDSSARINTTECARHELYVDFKEIGFSPWIIAPQGYSAYHCQGICESPLSQDQQPTNHATVQGIVHKMGLVADVHMPCCVPTKLLSTTILYFDDNENVVLKVYEDMIADRCGCR